MPGAISRTTNLCMFKNSAVEIRATAFCSENNLDRRGEPVVHVRAKLSDFTAQSSLPLKQPAPSYHNTPVYRGKPKLKGLFNTPVANLDTSPKKRDG